MKPIEGFPLQRANACACEISIRSVQVLGILFSKEFMQNVNRLSSKVITFIRRVQNISGNGIDVEDIIACGSFEYTERVRNLNEFILLVNFRLQC